MGLKDRLHAFRSKAPQQPIKTSTQHQDNTKINPQPPPTCKEQDQGTEPVSTRIDHFVQSLQVNFLTEKYDALLKSRYDKTGEWVLNAEPYLEWLKKDGPAFLWCSGKPGAGKSVISATLLKHLEDKLHSAVNGNKQGLAYIFFDYKSAESDASDYPAHLEKLSQLVKPTYDDYVVALRSVTQKLQKVQIVIDALDECQPGCQARILDLLKTLLVSHQKSSERSTVQVILTSRPNEEITKFYNSKLTDISNFRIEVRATNEDIQIFVTKTIENHEKHRKQDRISTPLLEKKELKREVIRILVEGADGMFLWAKLQVSHLIRLNHVDEVEEALENLPTSEEIENTYIRMLEKIEALGEREKRIAQSCLFWVTHAAKVLRFRELAEAVNLDLGEDFDQISSMETQPTLGFCANFLECSDCFEPVSFVHFSAIEFFRRGPSNMNGEWDFDKYSAFFLSHPQAELQLGKQCISYLIKSFGEEKATFSITNMGWFMMTHELVHYSCTNFDHHLEQADELDSEASSLVETFLSSDEAILTGFMLIRTLESVWDVWEFQQQIKFWPGHITRETIIRATALHRFKEFGLDKRGIKEQIDSNRWILHHAAFSGDLSLIESVLKNSPSEDFVQQVDARGATALYYAARQGYLDICRRLIDAKVPPDAGSGYSNPLQIAAFNGHLEVLRLLLENGANSLRQGGFYNTVLHAASWSGHYSIVNELLRRGTQRIDINARSESARTYCALQAAAFQGHDTVVCRLIDAGAEVDLAEPVPFSTEWGFPLHAAMRGGHLSIVKILLDSGADINGISGEMSGRGSSATVLQAAAGRGDIDAINFLISKGADVNLVAGDNGTALQAALQKGDMETVETLLKHGANINEQEGKYGNSLQAAIIGCNEQLVRYVLDQGISANEPGGYFKTPLIAAGKEGNFDVVKMLVEAGADLEPMDRNYGTALDAAAYSTHYDIVEYLLEKGASVRHALPEVASGKNVKLAEKMINAGADVNALCRSPYKVALQAAGWGGSSEMVRLLISKGADVNWTGGVYGNALHGAVYSGKLDNVIALIEAGAHIDATTGLDPNGTPLQCACLHLHEDIVKALLQNGANVNLGPAGDYGTALQAAVSKNYEPIVLMLLNEKADPNAKGGHFGSSLDIAKANDNQDMIKLLQAWGAAE